MSMFVLVLQLRNDLPPNICITLGFQEDATYAWAAWGLRDTNFKFLVCPSFQSQVKAGPITPV